MKILIFGGTAEGRQLSDFLVGMGFEVALSVVTDYGRRVLSPRENLEIRAKKMDEGDIRRYLLDCAFGYVVDATHPYAQIVTENIKSACDATGTNYLRLVRSSSLSDHLLTCVPDANAAADLLDGTDGNIFLTTGRKNLECFTKIRDYAARCYVRVIPDVLSLQRAMELGFSVSNIICMQGPFGEEINRAMFRMAGAKYIVTKDSGDVGGFDAKIAAAHSLGCEVIVIARPVAEEGYSWQELLDFFRSLSI